MQDSGNRGYVSQWERQLRFPTKPVNTWVEEDENYDDRKLYSVGCARFLATFK